LQKTLLLWLVGFNAGNHGTLFLMYGMVLIMTELISNNAAAQLTIPIAIEMAKQLKVNHKPFIMAVTIGATAAFALPLGYQYAPHGNGTWRLHGARFPQSRDHHGRSVLACDCRSFARSMAFRARVFPGFLF